MSHFYPKHGLQDGWPLDVEEINENFREVVGEIHGSLNEHNFQEDAFTTNDLMSTGAICRIYETHQAVDHGGVNGVESPGWRPDALLGSPTAIQVSNNRQWQTIISQTVTTGESIIWLMASFQQEPWWNWGDLLPGCQYALALNGSIIHETIVGGLDRSNDPKGEGNGTRSHPFALDAIIPVSSGNHEFSLQARMCADSEYTSYSSEIEPSDPEEPTAEGSVETSADPLRLALGRFYAVYSRQLIIVELR